MQPEFIGVNSEKKEQRTSISKWNNNDLSKLGTSGALSNSPVLFLLGQVKMILRTAVQKHLDIRNGTAEVPFLKSSVHAGSWCNDCSLSRSLNVLNQRFLDNLDKALAPLLRHNFQAKCIFSVSRGNCVLVLLPLFRSRKISNFASGRTKVTGTPANCLIRPIITEGRKSSRNTESSFFLSFSWPSL